MIKHESHDLPCINTWQYLRQVLGGECWLLPVSCYREEGRRCLSEIGRSLKCWGQWEAEQHCLAGLPISRRLLTCPILIPPQGSEGQGRASSFLPDPDAPGNLPAQGSMPRADGTSWSCL